MKTIQKVDAEINSSPDDSGADLLQLIHDDNHAVSELFFQFSQADEADTKEEIFAAIKQGLTIHASLVEQFLFPPVVETADDENKEEAEKLVAVAEAGNYIASLILDELAVTEPDDEYFEAKMKILDELVKKQVKREEKEMFDKLRAAEINFKDMGEEMAELKAELEEQARKSKKNQRAKGRTNAIAKSKGKARANAKSKSKPPKSVKNKEKTTTKIKKEAKKTGATKSSGKKGAR